MCAVNMRQVARGTLKFERNVGDLKCSASVTNSAKTRRKQRHVKVVCTEGEIGRYEALIFYQSVLLIITSARRQSLVSDGDRNFAVGGETMRGSRGRQAMKRETRYRRVGCERGEPASVKLISAAV
jgi:hypothetical protein